MQNVRIYTIYIYIAMTEVLKWFLNLHKSNMHARRTHTTLHTYADDTQTIRRYTIALAIELSRSAIDALACVVCEGCV